MNFDLSDRQAAVRSRARELAVSTVRSSIPEMEGTDRFPASVAAALRKGGLWGLPFPQALGGAGEGYLAYALALEEIAREYTAVAATLSVHTMAAATIFHYGTEEQKARFLPLLATGEGVGSFSFTELATGSNPRAITAQAVRDGDDFVLDGEKMFSSNSTLPGVAVVFARDQEKGGAVSAFLVPKDSHGFRAGPPVRKMGLFGFETAPFSLAGVRVPRENIVAGEAMRGRGFDILLEMIAIGKLGIAAQSLGLAERALDEAKRYAGERKQLNKPIRLLPTIQALAAEMVVDIEASRWLVYKAAYRRDQGMSIAFEAALAKLFCTEAAKRVVDRAMSVHGCYAYTKEFVVERLYREVKLGELYEGTPEIQKVLLAARVLWSDGEAT